jgi:hypothetical protein
MSTVKSVESQSLEEFEGWVREHQAGLRAFIRALGVDEAWVDDLAQEAVCRACALHEGHEHSPAIRVVFGQTTTLTIQKPEKPKNSPTPSQSPLSPM